MKNNYSIILAIAIILFSCFLFLRGIRWGLPDNNIKKFLTQPAGVSHQYIRKSWQISKERQNERLPRSVFNPIRSFHPDEQNILKSIAAMSPAQFDFNPHFFEYPSCQIYLVAITLKVLSSTGFVSLKSDIDYYFQYPDEMAKLYLSGRALTVLMGILGLGIFIRVAFMLCGRKGGLFAVACLGLSPLYVINSHYMTVDIPMVFWTLVFLYFAVSFVNKGKDYMLFSAAFFAGVACGTKYPAGILIFVLPFIYLYVFPESSRKILIDTLICFIIFFVGFFITTPYSLLSFDEFKRDLFYQAGARGVGANVLFSIISFFPEIFLSLWVGVFLIVLLFIPAIFFQARRRNVSDRLILTCMVLSIAPLMVAGGFKYARYYLLILLFLCLSAGSLFEGLFKIRKKSVRFLLILISIFFLAGSISKSVAYSNLMSRPDIRYISADYIDREIPPETEIVFTKDPWIFEVPPVSPLKYSVAVIGEKELKTAPSKSYLIVGELQYFLTSGNRKREMEKTINDFSKKGFVLKKVFTNYAVFGPLRFDENWTIHDMLYTHPRILLFYKL
ncbi:MAG: glycosyltransferase family 39 protein [Candidatus Omnitrophica bacterium]|nr:glycosyltransferase family 39 protein [Candidatus Omnitrophota bacterium]MCM8788478.1 glycosyltransferase family 39 protein [Candidatus Omnitrophota bacterium]